MDIQHLDDAVATNASKIIADFSTDYAMIRENMSRQLEILNIYSLVISSDPYVEQDTYTTMLITSLYKNLLSLYATLELTIKGMYGSARTIFRNIYEYLLLSKTIAITKDASLLERWEKGDDISLRKEVFKKVLHPKSSEMIEFWRALNEFNHATIYSQQIDFRYPGIKNETKFNIICNKMLLAMNYHVLNTYAANRSIQYYTQFMIDLQEDDSFITRKREIRSQIVAMSRSLVKEPKKVIYDFCLKWQFK